MSQTLRSDPPRSLQSVAIMEGSPFVYRPWGELYEAVVSGKPAFDRLYGISLFDHLAEHSEDAAIFNAAMTSGARLVLSAILAAYDF